MGAERGLPLGDDARGGLRVAPAGLGEADFAEELREAVQRVAGLPAMVVVGGHDPALGEETIRATWGEFWPDLRIEVLPDAGHYGPDEAPVRVATLVDAFLEQTRERAQAGSSGT